MIIDQEKMKQGLYKTLPKVNQSKQHRYSYLTVLNNY